MELPKRYTRAMSVAGTGGTWGVGGLYEEVADKDQSLLKSFKLARHAYKTFFFTVPMLGRLQATSSAPLL